VLTIPVSSSTVCYVSALLHADSAEAWLAEGRRLQFVSIISAIGIIKSALVRTDSIRSWRGQRTSPESIRSLKHFGGSDGTMPGKDELSGVDSFESIQIGRSTCAH